MAGRVRLVFASLMAAATLLLSGCFLSPGNFDATLDVRKDGHFTFTYTGEIYLLALSQLAEAAKKDSEPQEFAAEPCHDDDFKEHECSADELAEQRETWKGTQEQRRKNAAQESEQMKALLGGIDPADPKAAEELAQRLRRQEGWKRVDYKGDGLFEIEFSLTSQLGHDFMFPSLEQFPMTDAFLFAHLRQGRQVRIEAPGFSAQSATGNPFAAMMTGLASAGSPSGGQPEDLKIPEIDGTFRVVTDGRILTNNTDEGPKAVPGGQVIEWRITRRTQSAPVALIQLGA
jgi:hypothetical protein